MTTPTKARYRFLFRPLADPVEPVRTEELITEMEAGPFTPLEASVFGRMETSRKTMTTGETWVCDYSAIVEPTRTRHFPLQGLLLIVGCVILGYLIGWFLVTVGS